MKPVYFLLPLLTYQQAMAYTYEWDTDPTTSGAQGALVSPSIWNSSNESWWNSAFTQAWVSSQDAVFGGTPGIVQLFGDISVNDITFNSGNFTPPASSFAGAYEIKGATTNGQNLILSLQADDALDTPDITVAAGLRAIISTTHTNTGLTGGIGFTKLGSGTLILQQNTTVATSPITGAIYINAGRVIFDSIVPSTMEGTNAFPSLATTTPITVRNSAILQLDRSHLLGGSSSTGVKKIRLESSGILSLANSRQYLAEIDMISGAVTSTSRETTSAGIDELDDSALLTPNGGLLIQTAAHDSIVKTITPNIEVREGTLTFNVANGNVEPDLIINGAILSPTGSTQNVIKNGSGTLRLDSTNSFQGDLLVNAGMVTANAPDALGESTNSGAGEIRVASGGAVELGGSANLNSKNWFIAGNGPTGNGAIVNNSFNLDTNARIVNLTLTGDAAIGGNSNFSIGRSPLAPIPGSITGNGHTLTKRGLGEVRVNSASSNTNWALAGGTLTAGVTNAFGSNSIAITGGGTLRGFGNVIIPNPLDMSFGGNLGADSGQTIFTGLVNLGNSTLNFQVPKHATVSLNNSIKGIKGGPGPVTKSGDGTLIINQSAPSVQVLEGTLSGTGELSGNLTIENGATLSPGTTTPGTFTVGISVNLHGKWSAVIQGTNASRLVTVNTLSIQPGASLELADGNNYTEPLYILAEYGFLDGSFPSLPKPPFGYVFDMNHNGQNRIALVTAPPNAYTAWVTATGLLGNAADAGEDPDGDGLPNLMEFVLGTEPNPSNPGSMSAHQLPEIQVLSETQVSFTFRRLATATYANPVVRFGTDLSNTAAWTTAVHGSGGVTIAVTPNHYGVGIDRVITTLPRGTNPRLFARLEAALP